MKRTREEQDARNKYERDRRASIRLANPLPPRLTKEQAAERQRQRVKKQNELIKAKRNADRAAGIKPDPIKVSDKRKAQMSEYWKKKYAERKSLLPPKPPKQLKQLKKTKPIKMQQPLKQTPPKAVRPPKPDLFKQQIVTIKNSDEGKIKFQVKPGLWVMIFPDQDKEEVRDRYLNRAKI